MLIRQVSGGTSASFQVGLQQGVPGKQEVIASDKHFTFQQELAEHHSITADLKWETFCTVARLSFQICRYAEMFCQLLLYCSTCIDCILLVSNHQNLE